MKEIHYWYWLSSLWKIRLAKRQQLLAPYMSPKNLFEEHHIPWQCFPSWTEKDRMLFEKSRNPSRIEEAYHMLTLSGILFLPLSHEMYPALLKEIYDPPFGLFCLGNPSVLHKHTVGIVGTRTCSHYGASCAHSIAKYLAEQGVTVISGLAKGIDSHAHHGALASAVADSGNFCENNLSATAAVLGCGVDICYPKENLMLYEEIRQKGCLISEYPPGTPPLPYLFPLRNRLISGLCQALVIVEAKKKSGSLITADCALEQGRHIFAIPGRIYDMQSEGCNYLISQGAAPLLHPEFLLDALNISPCPRGKNPNFTKKTLEKQEILLYSCLDYEPLHIEEIARRSHSTATEICATLLRMELAGIISQPVHDYYAKQIEF